MTLHRLHHLHPIKRNPPILPAVKPANQTVVKPLTTDNSLKGNFNLSGLAAKSALLKRSVAPAAPLPTGAPPPPPTPILPARTVAPTQFIGPVAPVSGSVPATPGQLSLVESKDVSSVAYDAKKVGEVYKFADGSNWRVDKLQDNEGFFDTGFKAVAMRRVVSDGVGGFKDDPTDNRVAVGFAGTDGVNDVNPDIDQGTGFVPEQYKQGLAFTNEVRNQSALTCETVTATGHSLGGGIASYVSVQTGIPATGINSAPLSKGNIPGNPGGYDNQITQYHNNSEFLTGLNNINPFDARPGRDVVINATAPEKGSLNDVPYDVITQPFTSHKLGNNAPEIALPVKIYG